VTRRIVLLLQKDLRVLARSRSLAIALFAYPVLIASVVALVERDAGARPRIAWVDEAGVHAVVAVGSTRVSFAEMRARVASRVDLVPLGPAAAAAALDDGDVVAVVRLPRDLVTDLRSGFRQGSIEITTRGGVRGERALREAQAFVYELNAAVQREVLGEAVEFLRVLAGGGDADLAGETVSILGLARAADIAAAVQARSTDARDRADLARVLDFVRAARVALAFADPSLQVVAAPVALTSTVRGDDELLGDRGIALALAAGVVLAGLLLGAAALATEREEQTLVRLQRAGIGPGALLAAKVAFVATISVVLSAVAVGMRLALSGGLDGSGAAFGVLVLAGAVAGAIGLLVASLVRELAPAVFVSLLAAVPFLLAALVGPGAGGVGAIAGAFPFAPAGEGVRAAFAGAPIGGAVLHLALLGAAALAAARTVAHRGRIRRRVQGER
jgi:ABC-2 family transporter protein